MPVVAVLGAVLAVGTVPGIIAAGTLTALGAMTAIGATLGAIGAVTKNKTLMMIGGGMALVGGIGTLLSSTATTAASESVFANVADSTNSELASWATGTDFSVSAVGAAGTAADAASGLGAAAESFTDWGTLAAGVSDGAVEGVSAAVDGMTDWGTLSAGASEGAEAGSASSLTGVSDTDFFKSISADAAKEATGNIDMTFAAPKITPTDTSFFGPDGNLVGGEKGFFGRLGDWAGKHERLSTGIIMAGGQFISGLTDPMNPAKIETLNAQSEAYRAQAALTNKQVANMSQNMPTVKVTGAPNQNYGIINASAPFGLPAITGAPNTGAVA